MDIERSAKRRNALKDLALQAESSIGLGPASIGYGHKRKVGVFFIVVVAAIVVTNVATGGATADRPPQGSVPGLDVFAQSGSVVEGNQSIRVMREPADAVSGANGAVVQSDWPMLAANPQRTSWTPEEVRGNLDPLWYRPIEPYINYKIQVIAANDRLFISTARGLYAFHTGDNPAYSAGELAWIYPTELPLGHSPTVSGDTLYVGGYDRLIHAIDVSSGQAVPTWDLGKARAQAGFETNPLVVDGRVYAGSRDGYFYAYDASTGDRVWRYPPEPEGPIGLILFSAAHQDSTIYFASNDSHAYALDATDGSLIWKSGKLPGAGFHSYWPVVHQDWVILAGSNNYAQATSNTGFPDIGPTRQVTIRERDELYPNHQLDPRGTLIGPAGTEPGQWVGGTVTIDTSTPTCTANGCTRPVTEYLETKPWRRTVFVLNRFTGQELTYDSDNDSIAEYAPFLWTGTTSGNRYPPVIGSDGVMYQQNNYMSDAHICGGQAVGWKLGTPFISRVSFGWNAVDEPMAFSAGGSLVYWSNTCDRAAGAYDIATPLGAPGGEWDYFSLGLEDIIPGYNTRYYKFADKDYGDLFGTVNGVYGCHGTQNPPIPYKGRLYMLRGNALVAFGSTTGGPIQLPLVDAVDTQSPRANYSLNQLKQRLATEVQGMLDAGHLRPGYHSTGHWDIFGNPSGGLGDYLDDYFHSPSDTLYALILALPHLPSDLQAPTRQYIQEEEFAVFSATSTAHIGWSSGAARELFEIPPEVQQGMDGFPPRPNSGTWYDYPASWWLFPQHSFYGLWWYAQEFGGAGEIFDQIRNKLESPPSDSYLAVNPHIHNAYVAGYIGYLELQVMAGEPESPAVRVELDRLMALRVSNFSKDSPITGDEINYGRVMNVSRNFMYLVPELADHLRDHVLAQVEEAVTEYNDIVPGWFVSKYDATYGEGALQPLYDYHALFQAKALVLDESRHELAKYLDVPAFAVGDLFYIQNLVAVIEAGNSLTKSAIPIYANQGSAITYTLSFNGSGSTLLLTDTLSSGVGSPGSFELDGTSVSPLYDSEKHILTWSDIPEAGQVVTIRYTVAVTTSRPRILINSANLREVGGELVTATATVVANPFLSYLPLILEASRP